MESCDSWRLMEENVIALCFLFWSVFPPIQSYMRPVFHLCFGFWVNLISLPSPVCCLPLSVPAPQVTPVVWWHTACPSSSSTRTLWTWVDLLLTPSGLLRWHLLMCVCVSIQEGWGLKQVIVGTRVWSTGRLVGVALCVLTGAGN